MRVPVDRVGHSHEDSNVDSGRARLAELRDVQGKMKRAK
jgi:hypothetical protein